MKLLYVCLLPAVVLLFVFRHIRMYGIVIAFQDFTPARGIPRSPWNNSEHFDILFTSFVFWQVLPNTAIISLYRIILHAPRQQQGGACPRRAAAFLRPDCRHEPLCPLATGPCPAPTGPCSLPERITLTTI